VRLVRDEPVLPLALRQHLLRFGVMSGEQQHGRSKSRRCEKSLLEH